MLGFLVCQPVCARLAGGLPPAGGRTAVVCTKRARIGASMDQLTIQSDRLWDFLAPPRSDSGATTWGPTFSRLRQGREPHAWTFCAKLMWVRQGRDGSDKRDGIKFPQVLASVFGIVRLHVEFPWLCPHSESAASSGDSRARNPSGGKLAGIGWVSRAAKRVAG